MAQGWPSVGLHNVASKRKPACKLQADNVASTRTLRAMGKRSCQRSVGLHNVASAAVNGLAGKGLVQQTYSQLACDLMQTGRQSTVIHSMRAPDRAASTDGDQIWLPAEQSSVDRQQWSVDRR